ncbi:MAG TPA: GNAT family N-acetyltransferase [Gaiellaceae bacterium]|nr:GNAT family N-acetyltransferase [Gaiellaceae bacterium]
MPGSNASVTVARSVEEVERLRTAWQGLDWSRIDADVDFYLTVLRSRENVVRPHVAVVRRDDAVEAMAVARLEDVELTSSVGYRAVHRPRVRAITLVHGGIPGGIPPEAVAALVGELRAALARREADVLVLPSLRTGGPAHEAALSGPSLPREQGEPRTHRRLCLPASLADLMCAKSTKTREGVKRYRKRLVNDHGDGLSVRRLQGVEDAERVFRDLPAVASKTYQHGLGVAFAATEEQRALTLLGLERRWFRAYVLYLDGDPIAFWPGFAYRGTFFIGTPGYDPALGEYRIGQHLMLEMIDDLCRDGEISYLDYGFGDAEYKRRFGDESWEEADLLLYAPTARNRRIRATRQAVSVSVRTARRMLGDDRQARLKQAWRRRRAAV